MKRHPSNALSLPRRTRSHHSSKPVDVTHWTKSQRLILIKGKRTIRNPACQRDGLHLCPGDRKDEGEFVATTCGLGITVDSALHCPASPVSKLKYATFDLRFNGESSIQSPYPIASQITSKSPRKRMLQTGVKALQATLRAEQVMAGSNNDHDMISSSTRTHPCAESSTQRYPCVYLRRPSLNPRGKARQAHGTEYCCIVDPFMLS